MRVPKSVTQAMAVAAAVSRSSSLRTRTTAEVPATAEAPQIEVPTAVRIAEAWGTRRSLLSGTEMSIVAVTQVMMVMRVPQPSPKIAGMDRRSPRSTTPVRSTRLDVKVRPRLAERGISPRLRTSMPNTMAKSMAERRGINLLKPQDATAMRAASSTPGVRARKDAAHVAASKEVFLLDTRILCLSARWYG